MRREGQRLQSVKSPQDQVSFGLSRLGPLWIKAFFWNAARCKKISAQVIIGGNVRGLFRLAAAGLVLTASQAYAADIFDLRFFDVDDTMTAEISNSLFTNVEVNRANFSQDNPYVDISSYVAPGANSLNIKLFNGPAGYTYGYDLRKNGVSIAMDQCGVWNTFGCDNDRYAQGLVFTRQISFDGGGMQDEATTAAVPEPSTWMMMIGGFGFIGWHWRRKAEASRRVQMT